MQKKTKMINKKAKEKFVPLKPDLWGPMTEAELKRAKSLEPLAKGMALALKEDEDTGLRL